ncbi:MAG: adenylyl-sulfate kinase [Syntrophobacterales bacterium]|jgi:bifunctional enzyme CysN/CysC|nr:adenylyl-sulfate kinase [Syntrophobacterales bacterium]
MIPKTEHMSLVIVGHVDHGKSTVLGRLLVDTGSLPEGKLEQIRANCERNSKPFEYAFLIDALKDEQSQGITIDSARVFFRTKKRNYTLIDAPGHIEFLKNMVTGASRAEAAFLVIDAEEGVRENSRRHGYMLSMLGIRQTAIIVNKMDLVDFNKTVYEQIVTEYKEFLSRIGVTPICFLPASARTGEGIAGFNGSMPWHEGPSVLEVLDSFEKEVEPTSKSFRMPVQDVYKFTRYGDSRRIVAGTVLTGSVEVGDELIFFPSGKKGRIKTIESFNTASLREIQAGYAAGFTLDEQIYVTRGELAVKADEPMPKVTTRLRVNLFWLGKEPFRKKKEYILKLGATRVPVHIEEITRAINASDLHSDTERDGVKRHEVADCILKSSRAVAFDASQESALTGRFVIVDNYEICGGGIVREGLEDKQTWVRDKVFLRDYKWERSAISLEMRTEKYNQKPTLIIITGQKNSGKKPVAKALERKLFSDGKIVYFLGIGNVLYGIDADIKDTGNYREEHIRRLSEAANLLLNAGVIVVATAIELTSDDLEIIKTVVEPEKIEVVWVGEYVTTDIPNDLVIPDPRNTEEAVDLLKNLLQERGIIFRPW